MLVVNVNDGVGFMIDVYDFIHGKKVNGFIVCLSQIAVLSMHCSNGQDGQYVPDNSGQYNPDDSGRYVHVEG